MTRERRRAVGNMVWISGRWALLASDYGELIALGSEQTHGYDFILRQQGVETCILERRKTLRENRE